MASNEWRHFCILMSMKNLIYLFFVVLSLHANAQDTIYTCTKLDTYIAPYEGLMFKDSICYLDRKLYTGVLVVNCIGDGKSRRNNGVYYYEKGRIVGSQELDRKTKLQSNEPMSIGESSLYSFSGGMRKEFGGDHRSTSTFSVSVNTPVVIDSIIYKNKTFVLADSIQLVSTSFRFQVSDSFSGNTGQTTTVGVLDIDGNRYFITDYTVGKYRTEALRIYYSINGSQRFCIEKKYDSTKSEAAP